MRNKFYFFKTYQHISKFNSTMFKQFFLVYLTFKIKWFGLKKITGFLNIMFPHFLIYNQTKTKTTITTKYVVLLSAINAEIKNLKMYLFQLCLGIGFPGYCLFIYLFVFGGLVLKLCRASALDSFIHVTNWRLYIQSSILTTRWWRVRS